MIEINKDPSKKELRWFGLLFAAFCGLLGLMIWWQFDALHVSKVIWIVGPSVAAIYYAVPPVRKYIYLGFIYLTFPIGLVISNLLMGITYYLVLTPIGLVMRLFRSDPMTRKIEPEATTYWIQRKPATDTSRYFKQF